METTLVAERRETFGKNEAVRLRLRGRIPAVLYGGPGGQPQSLAVDPKDLSRLLHSKSGVNTLIALELDGDETRVLVKEYQLDPVTHQLLHADFYRIAMDKVIEVTVPIHLTGEAKGVKAQGGLVDFVHRELEIACLPGDIPEAITVDITELMLNDGVRVRDLESGGTWKALSEPDMLIVHVVPPRVEAEPEPTEAVVAPAATAEPEVIKKGKPEEAEAKE